MNRCKNICGATLIELLVLLAVGSVVISSGMQLVLSGTDLLLRRQRTSSNWAQSIAGLATLKSDLGKHQWQQAWLEGESLRINHEVRAGELGPLFIKYDSGWEQVNYRWSKVGRWWTLRRTGPVSGQRVWRDQRFEIVPDLWDWQQVHLVLLVDPGSPQRMELGMARSSSQRQVSYSWQGGFASSDFVPLMFAAINDDLNCVIPEEAEQLLSIQSIRVSQRNKKGQGSCYIFE